MNKHQIIKALIFLNILVIISFQLVQAFAYQEIKDTTNNLTASLNTTELKIKAIDKYLFKTNKYTYLDYVKSITTYWYDRVGDCTEVARLKYIMYKNIGLQARIVHGCIIINNSCGKHDYVEYYLNGVWNTTEQKYFISKLERRGRGLWR
jgi:transglutaminase-like putative cysteine protease